MSIRPRNLTKKKLRRRLKERRALEAVAHRSMRLERLEARHLLAGLAGNEAPVAVDDDGLVSDVNSSVVIHVLANDRGADGPDALTVLSSQEAPGTLTAANGTVSGPDESGRLVYTPNDGFLGIDTFTYRVRNPLGLQSSAATVTVITTHFPDTTPDGPVSTLELEPVRIDILANDSDQDGSLIPSSVSIFTQPTKGIVEIDSVTGAVTYTSNDIHFAGSDSIIDAFEYTVTDNSGAVSDPTPVTVEVIRISTPYQNPRNQFDVNNDTVVTPFDLLLILSHLQTVGNKLPDPPPPPFLDVNGDNAVSASDLRLVLEHLNSPAAQGEQSGEQPEGEQPEGEPESLAETLLAPPQESSIATTRLDRAAPAPQPVVRSTTRSMTRRTSEMLVVVSVVGEPRHSGRLHKDAPSDDRLDSYLDEIAEESRSRTRTRTRRDLVDDALMDIFDDV